MQPFEVGNYVIREELGRGAFGQVYKAYSLGRGPVRICAAKKLSVQSDHQECEAVGELNTLENLPNHKHIARLIGHEEVLTPSHCIWLFLEFCEGGTLGDYVFRNPQNVDAKRQLTFQLADAVAFLHSQHIVHRDLKPQNLMIKDRSSSELPILKVVDFGLATVCDRLDSTKVTKIWGKRQSMHEYFTASLGGTPFYLAPEAHTGHNWTTAVDIFSMGLIMWAMFDNLNSSNAGQEPYLAPCVRNSKGHPEAIGHILSRGRSVDPNLVMKNEPRRRDLVFMMIDPNYKKRPTADKVFNDLKLVDDQSDQNDSDNFMTHIYNRARFQPSSRSTQSSPRSQPASSPIQPSPRSQPASRPTQPFVQPLPASLSHLSNPYPLYFQLRILPNPHPLRVQFSLLSNPDPLLSAFCPTQTQSIQSLFRSQPASCPTESSPRSQPTSRPIQFSPRSKPTSSPSHHPVHSRERSAHVPNVTTELSRRTGQSSNTQSTNAIPTLQEPKFSTSNGQTGEAAITPRSRAYNHLLQTTLDHCASSTPAGASRPRKRKRKRSESNDTSPKKTRDEYANRGARANLHQLPEGLSAESPRFSQHSTWSQRLPPRSPGPGSSPSQNYRVDREQARRARWERRTAATIERTTKACPGCKVRTEKNDGCMHMTCPMCGFHWCWLCEIEWGRNCQDRHWFGDRR